MSLTSINSWLAFDIGGANIKAADGRGWSHSEPFAMWQDWKRLPDAIAHIKSLHPATHYAVTMTGEIADCFSDRREGVEHEVQDEVWSGIACLEHHGAEPRYPRSPDSWGRGA